MSTDNDPLSMSDVQRLKGIRKNAAIERASIERQVEKDIESDVREYAVSAGWFTRKFSSEIYRYAPAQLMINHHGYVIFVDFVAKGKRISRLKLREQVRMINNGAKVFTVDSVESGIALLKSLNSVNSTTIGGGLNVNR